MKKFNEISLLKEAVSETLWPTRCAICDKPGYLLCPECSRKLPYIDQLKTCQTCGEPFGNIQCCGCNEHSNFDKCTSIFFLNNDTGKIITTYKDAGERRLASVIAYFLSKAVNPNWIDSQTFLTYIPSSKEAYLRRGFDHAKLIAEYTRKMLDIDLINCFLRPASNDQRKLGRAQRAKNLSGKFKFNNDAERLINYKYNKVLVIDDVFTTGSTLQSASLCLKENGIEKVHCLNFSRTF